jgi:hypothetical protein
MLILGCDIQGYVHTHTLRMSHDVKLILHLYSQEVIIKLKIKHYNDAFSEYRRNYGHLKLLVEISREIKIMLYHFTIAIEAVTYYSKCWE